MNLPSFEEYLALMRRLKSAMDWVSEELETLASGVEQEEVATRLRDIALCVSFRIGNELSDPVPEGLPDIATTPTPVVGTGERPLVHFPPHAF